MRYDKLVRDRVPEHIRSRGGTPVIHVADDREYWTKLKEKLLEEFQEFSESETIEEMADMREVLEAICDFKGFDRRELEAVMAKKAGERGAFKKKIILEES